ncbi:MAG: M12 family metallo-peptidase [Pyrinomonadaceae bacterium]
MKKQKSFRRLVTGLCVLALVSAAAFALSPPASGQRPQLQESARVQVRQDLGKALHGYDELSFDSAVVHKQVRETGQFTLATSRGNFELALEPHDLRAPHYRAEAWGKGGAVRVLERAPVRTYKGPVRGIEGAQARFTIDEGTLEGIIITRDGLYFLEAARSLSPAAAATDFVFYSAASVKHERNGECGVTLAQKVEAEAARVQATPVAATGPAQAEVFTPAFEVDIATEADFEYFTAKGADVNATNNEILGIMNQVDGIYGAQIGLRFRVVFSRVWTTADDPYAATEPAAALTELRTSYNGNPPPNLPSHDIVHLWTGRDLDGATVGISYRIGFECPATGYGYGISQDVPGNRASLTAHEIGHNFGASHPSDAEPECEGTIMDPSMPPSTDFCQVSRNQIINHAVENSACLTQKVAPGCTYTISPTLQQFGTAGGSGSVNVTAGAGCAWAAAEGIPWVGVTANETGTGNGLANFSVDANTGGPRQGRVDIAGQSLTIQQSASANCMTTPIGAGSPINGSLSTSDCRSGQPDRPDALIDLYTFSGTAGQQVRIEMNAAVAPPTGIDTYLYLFGPSGNIVALNDDIVPFEDKNSRVPVNGFVTLQETGTYTIEATSYFNGETGAYSLTLTVINAVDAVAFSSATYAVSESVQPSGVGTEGAGFVTITVTRSGNTSGAASVDFATVDGTAESRKDYTKALGTLRFAANDTAESFTVLISDDRFVEANETINLTLNNPVGATLGTLANAVITLTSANDVVDGPSPVKDASFDAAFFVRQHYHDFLNREPDVDGLNFWVGQTTGCGNPNLLVCRINVSAAFFLSIEFQETGYLVYRMYKAAYGDINPPAVPVAVRLDEFLRDTLAARQGVAVGVGNWREQLEANKNALAAEFVTRERFTAALPPALAPEQFVAALNTNAGGSLSQGKREALAAALMDGTMTRAQVLREVAEDQTLRDAQFNRAFVLMQYFGYLRRDPDTAPDGDFGGYNFWLGKLNQFGGNFVEAEMVKAFLSSGEYTSRFGQ